MFLVTLKYYIFQSENPPFLPNLHWEAICVIKSSRLTPWRTNRRQTAPMLYCSTTEKPYYYFILPKRKISTRFLFPSKDLFWYLQLILRSFCAFAFFFLCKEANKTQHWSFSIFHFHPHQKCHLVLLCDAFYISGSDWRFDKTEAYRQNISKVLYIVNTCLFQRMKIWRKKVQTWKNTFKSSLTVTTNTVESKVNILSKCSSYNNFYNHPWARYTTEYARSKHCTSNFSDTTWTNSFITLFKKCVCTPPSEMFCQVQRVLTLKTF